jgi:hypothetical protein
MAVGWQEIKTAPHGELLILGWVFDVERLGRSWEMEMEIYHGDDHHKHVTHWMPAPSPPPEF